MARQNQDDRLLRFDKSTKTQFLESGQRDSGRRLAAYAIGADFSFSHCNFNFCNLLDRAASRLQHSQRFLPRCRIAYPYGSRKSVGNDGFKLLAAKLEHTAVERMC